MTISRTTTPSKIRRACLGLVAALGLGMTAAPAALAQETNWPSKPIRLIVPFAAGGTTDIIARVIADPLGRELGQNVIVDNRGGGGGTIGAMELIRANADGYALGVSTISTLATNPAINPKITYNPLTDFTPVSNIANVPNVLVINPQFGPTNHASFLAKLKAEQGQHSFASSGTGGIQHLLMEIYKSLTGTYITHIPYRGAGPALTDTVAGQVPMLLDNLPSALGFIREKRLIPIAVASDKRVEALPDVPTFKELGLEPVNRMASFGIVGPKGMKPEVVAKLNAAIHKVLQDPAVRKRIAETGSVIAPNTPEEFARNIRVEFDAYKQVVTQQKLTLN